MLSAWTQLGECSLGCGGGTVTWVRTVETPASHGGEQCGDTRAELRQCNEHPCPIDGRYEGQFLTKSVLTVLSCSVCQK